MDKKLRTAKDYYNRGDKGNAVKLLGEILQEDPNNGIAWYALALSFDDNEKKIYCLQRTLKLNPQNERAHQLLEELTSASPVRSPNSYTTSANSQAVTLNDGTYQLTQVQKINTVGKDKVIVKENIITKYWWLISTGLLFLIIFMISGAKKDKPYQPTADDAFDHVAGYALEEMYERDPLNYWCDGNEKGSWYKIQVIDKGNGRFFVIGAIKAISEYCVYQSGYFSAIIKYNFSTTIWNLEGDVYFSNPCMTIDETDGGREKCTNWIIGWKPDMNWRPPNE